MAQDTSTSPLLGTDRKSQPQYSAAPFDTERQIKYYESNAAQNRRRHPRLRRFCHFLFITVFALFVLHKVHPHFRHLIPGFHGHKHQSLTMENDIPGMPWLDLEDSDVEWECVSGDLWNFQDSHRPHDDGRLLASTSFEVPVDADALNFLARGAYSYGHVDIGLAGEPGDNVKVDVEASYYTRHALDRAKVCRFKCDRFGQGVAVLTPKHRHDHDYRDLIRFNLSIQIPPNAAGLRHIPSLHSYFPLFGQTLHSTSEAVEFAEAGLHSTNMPVEVKDVRARQFFAHTSNAPVSGSFNTTSKIHIITSNAPITVDVTAYNVEEQANEVLIHTTNSPLNANLSLLASPTLQGPSSFNVTATTSNSRLQVTHLTSPADSIQHLHFATSNAPAYVRLDPAFEGTFTATSSIFAPKIQQIQGAEDPAGRGRTRKLLYDLVVRYVARGTVSWEPSEHERGKPGSIILASSNSPVYLTL